MNPFDRPALEWLVNSTKSIFQTSGRKSLLLTGYKRCGKTTLCNALVGERLLPGVRSRVIIGLDGQPSHVLLEERLGSCHCIIGRRYGMTMQADTSALNTIGVKMMDSIFQLSDEWVVVDEIGFLEQSAHLYQTALLRLFQTRRVLAVLRKSDTPFLHALRTRDDCTVLDIDEWRKWI